jgi:hypothetical protein
MTTYFGMFGCPKGLGDNSVVAPNDVAWLLVGETLLCAHPLDYQHLIRQNPAGDDSDRSELTKYWPQPAHSVTIDGPEDGREGKVEGCEDGELEQECTCTSPIFSCWSSASSPATPTRWLR